MKNKIISMAFTILYGLTLMSCGDNATSLDAFTYTRNETGYTITGLNDETLTKIVIPSSVTKIADSAFSNKYSITSVSIPNSVTYIGDYAFTYCTSLASISVGKGITYIGKSAFSNTAYYLDESNWDDDVLYIGKYLIAADTNLFGEYSIKNGTTCIGGNAFSNCTYLTSIIIPNSVTSIGSYVFYKCSSLASISIGSGVTSISEDAFTSCAYYNNGDNWDNEVLYIDNYLICSTVAISKSYTVNDGTTLIADYAFSGCTSLTSVSIPSSVKYIGECAFFDCTSLSSIDVDASNSNYISVNGHLYTKDGSTFIQYARGSSSTSFTLIDRVKTISSYAFYGCTKLTSVEIPSSVKTISSYAFQSAKLTSLTIPDSVTYIGEYAFASCSSLSTITLGSGITSIQEESFAGCTALTYIIIPEGVETIDKRAFRNCTSLRTVVIPESISVIGQRSFYGCSALKYVCYAGSSSGWPLVTIDNSYITSYGSLYFYSETEPAFGGNYWHYVDGVPTPW